VLRARLVPEQASRDALAGKRCLAFAGIGDPGRFFATLRQSHIDVVREAAFPDHHPFTAGEIGALVADAAREGLTLVTTQKDWVRLNSDPALAAHAAAIVPFGVTLAIGEGNALRDLVTGVLAARRGGA
jgi:tetraacyldisaccharide 4'-kinase